MSYDAGMEGEEGRSSKRSAAAKKPRTKQLLCEQDPEAPGLTLEQRRKIRRHVSSSVFPHIICIHRVGASVAEFLSLKRAWPDMWRTMCRRINNRASARRVRQKREEDLQKITGLVSSACMCSLYPLPSLLKLQYVVEVGCTELLNLIPE